MAGRSRWHDLVGRRAPEALRRGLTFWRRSIQARVVVSTVLLSAVVIAAVGWFLLRQVEHGLVQRRVDAILAEVASENSQAESVLRGTPGTDTNATRQALYFVLGLSVNGQARGFRVVMVAAGRPGQRLQDRGPEATRRADLDSIPRSLIDHFDALGAAAPTSLTVWTFTTQK